MPLRSLSWTILSVLFALALPSSGGAGEDVSFTGYRVCAKCHDLHASDWKKTPHYKAGKNLKPGQRAEAKIKAKLDPDKDYSADPNCLGCHATGFGRPGGYDPKDPDKTLSRVGCESCHGAGSRYREIHGDAERRMIAEAEATPRKALVDAGQNFDFAEACARCHLNFQGSPWEGAKAPYTPFTPTIDGKYTFDFETAVRGDGVHTHFKLYNIFRGPPVPPFREEFQSTAKEAN